MSQERTKLAPARRVPKPRGSVIAARQHQSAIRRKRDIGHREGTHTIGGMPQLRDNFGGQRLRYNRADIRRYRLQMTIDEDDLPPPEES